jgi:hypothetical protein
VNVEGCISFDLGCWEWENSFSFWNSEILVYWDPFGGIWEPKSFGNAWKLGIIFDEWLNWKTSFQSVEWIPMNWKMSGLSELSCSNFPSFIWFRIWVFEES